MKHLIISATILFTFQAAWAKPKVVIYPAPKGEALSTDYSVAVDGKAVPVYLAKVAPGDRTLRMKAMDDKVNSASYFETASFAYFDFDGEVTVTVKIAGTVKSAKILPSSVNIVPVINGESISFKISSAQNFVIEINGEIIKSLQLFANPIEKDKPGAHDPNVIYYGPGIHEISHLLLGDNKILYLAGGAVLRTVISPDEKFTTNASSGLKNYAPSIIIMGKHVKIMGRGIIDGSACTTHAKNMIFIKGQDVSLEGVILRDASLWTVPVRESDGVDINNIKLLGHRANSDGIDICNSTNVVVRNCFIRTLDDLVVIKSSKGKGDTKNITVKNCVLWNEVAHALSVGAEINEDIKNVLFTDCDVVHDLGREWTLRVYHCDAAVVSDIRFENIRVEESKRLISLWIGKAIWTTDEKRGHINGVVFNNISAKGDPLTVDLVGFGDENKIADVAFNHVTVNGQPLKEAQIKSNAFVDKVRVMP